MWCLHGHHVPQTTWTKTAKQPTRSVSVSWPLQLLTLTAHSREALCNPVGAGEIRKGTARRKGEVRSVYSQACVLT